MKEIILASASPRRQDLLNQIGISFIVEPSNIDESKYKADCAEDLVKRLSYEKALSITCKAKDNSLVIGADTVVYKDSILGKPNDSKQAFEMLKLLQGEWHEVITGFAVIDSTDLTSITDFEKTRVKMRKMSDDLIKSYIMTGEPMDKAGAYGIQGMGAMLVERIEGCYFNVVGLPLVKLGKALENFGVKIL